jgi:hypothetical protein
VPGGLWSISGRRRFRCQRSALVSSPLLCFGASPGSPQRLATAEARGRLSGEDALVDERRASPSRGRNDAELVYGARLVSAEREGRRTGPLGNTAFREADAIRWNSLLSESVFAPTWAPHTLQV